MNRSAFAPPSRPARILLDTDMATDCDDAGAIAVLHALADAGEADIRAILVNNRDPASVGAVAALNAFYRRPRIPLGAYQGDAIGAPAGPFVHALAADTQRYGHTIRSRADVPDAVSVYRQTLAVLGDGLGVIVSIGHLNNLHDLLASCPDGYSPLSGRDLVRQKVAHVVMMGGDYPASREHNFFARGSDAVTAAVLRDWPTPILFSGYTLGRRIKTGIRLASLPEAHPVRRAYALHHSEPLKNGRASWDQTAVLAAVRGPAPFWGVSEPGENLAASDGSNFWTPGPRAPHFYLVENAPAADAAAEIEALMFTAGTLRNHPSPTSCIS